MAKYSVFVVALFLAITLNYLNEPIPEDLPGWLPTKLWLGAVKAVFSIAPVVTTLGYDEAQFNQNGVWFLAKIFPVFLSEDITLTDASFDGVPVKIFRPPAEKLTGKGVLYFHGGGWVVGDYGFFVEQLSRVARELGAVVVFVDYRVAPKHPFPAAADDCIASYKYFVENAENFRVDPSRISVMGDSAGGNLAAVVSLATLSENYTPMPKLQVLIYPVVQGSNLHTPSYVANEYGPLLTSDMMAFFFAAYIFGDDYQQYIPIIRQSNHTSSAEKKSNAKTQLSTKHLPDDVFKANYAEKLDFGNSTLWKEIKEKFRHPHFAPIFAEKMEGLPTAYITTCQYDVLRDDGYYYAKHLRDARVKVEHQNFVCFHTWTYIMSFVKEYYDEFTKMLEYMEANI